VLVGLIVVAASPGAARAGIPIIWGNGDTVAHVANLPEGHPASVEVPGAAVGYKYSRFHIYWCDLWTSSGEYCLYHDNQFIPLGPDAMLAAKKLGMPEGSIRRPIFYLFPLGWVLIGGVVVVATAWNAIQKRNSPEARAEALLKKPLYQEACEIAGAGPNGYENAVSFLVGQGVKPEKAEADMALVLGYLRSLTPPPVPPGTPPAGEAAVDL